MSARQAVQLLIQRVSDESTVTEHSVFVTLSRRVCPPAARTHNKFKLKHLHPQGDTKALIPADDFTFTGLIC